MRRQRLQGKDIHTLGIHQLRLAPAPETPEVPHSFPARHHYSSSARPRFTSEASYGSTRSAREARVALTGTAPCALLHEYVRLARDADLRDALTAVSA